MFERSFLLGYEAPDQRTEGNPPDEGLSLAKMA